MRGQPAVFWLAALAAAALRGEPCACGPHGVCSGGRCLCRSPFTGPRCERRALVDSGHYYALLEPLSPSASAGAVDSPGTAKRAAPRVVEQGEPSRAPAERPVDIEQDELARAATERILHPAEARAREGLERWGQHASRAVVAEPPREGVVGSAPLGAEPLASPHALVGRMKAGLGPEEYEQTVETVSDFNQMTRFLLDISLILAIVILIVLISFLIKHSGEVGARLFYLVAGDTRLRMNSMDFMGASMLPSTVVRIERIILHDIPGSEGRDVFVEVDFGTNMLASTRVRIVQPVAAWSEPRAMQTLPEKDRPQKNRVVFTDKLEFNVRPFGEGDMIFRVKDQGILGSELIGSVRLPAYDVLKKAKQNEYAQALNYSACLSNPLKPAGGRQSRARILIWVMLGDTD